MKDVKKCPRVTLSPATKRRLWSESAGHCQKPSCAVYLFDPDSNADFAEMAHIIAATTGGPRDVPVTELSEEMRADHSNIVLLCANCHTVVDKDADRYPKDEIFRWKTLSQEKRIQAFGTPEFKVRGEARAYIEPLLSENHAVFNRYGPTKGDFSEERSFQWRKHVVQKVIPNNAAIRRFLKHNRNLLDKRERRTADEFAIHADEFEARHILGEWGAGTQEFPTGMDTIFEDNA